MPETRQDESPTPFGAQPPGSTNVEFLPGARAIDILVGKTPGFGANII